MTRPDRLISVLLRGTTVSFQSILGHALGGAAEGLFISQLMWEEEQTGRIGEWFSISSEQIRRKTCLTSRQQERIKNILQDPKIGILEVQTEGPPFKSYFRINEQRLKEVVEKFVDDNPGYIPRYPKSEGEKYSAKKGLSNPTSSSDGNENAPSKKLDGNESALSMATKARYIKSEDTSRKEKDSALSGGDSSDSSLGEFDSPNDDYSLSGEFAFQDDARVPITLPGEFLDERSGKPPDPYVSPFADIPILSPCPAYAGVVYAAPGRTPAPTALPDDLHPDQTHTVYRVGIDPAAPGGDMSVSLADYERVEAQQPGSIAPPGETFGDEATALAGELADHAPEPDDDDLAAIQAGHAREMARGGGNGKNKKAARASLDELRAAALGMAKPRVAGDLEPEDESQKARRCSATTFATDEFGPLFSGLAGFAASNSTYTGWAKTVDEGLCKIYGIDGVGSWEKARRLLLHATRAFFGSGTDKPHWKAKNANTPYSVMDDLVAEAGRIVKAASPPPMAIPKVKPMTGDFAEAVQRDEAYMANMRQMQKYADYLMQKQREGQG